VIRPQLIALAERCQVDLSEISNLISRAYFAHTEAPLTFTNSARQTARESGAS